MFLQDGSYSRGPVQIPVGEVDESKYYLTPTYKFEQVGSLFCLSCGNLADVFEFYGA